MARLPQPGGDQRSQQQFIVFENFEKLNTKDDRVGLKENQLAWLENLQPIAPNKLLTVPAPSSTALTSGSETVDIIFYATVNAVDYLICFTTVGACFAVQISNGVVFNIAQDGTFSTAPDVTTWQGSRILINDSKAGYCTWDTLTFVQQGGVSPNIPVIFGGNSYSSAPSVTLTGGTGTGATAQAVVSNGIVVAVQLTAPGHGYLATDIIAVTFSGGGVGTGGRGLAVMSGGAVTALPFTSNAIYQNPGNYPLVFTGGGGTGASGTCAIGSNGAINAVTLVTGGSGYTTAPNVSIGPAAGPTFPDLLSGSTTIIATMGTQTVSSITVKQGGQNYPPGTPSTLVVTIVGGGAGGVTPTNQATATANVNASGVITGFNITNHGAGYIVGTTPIVQLGGLIAVAAAHVWPFIPFGTTLAVFQGRVWLGGGNVSNATAPSAVISSSGSSYTSGTGVVVLQLNSGASNFSVNGLIIVSGLTGTGTNLSSLNGTFTVTAISAGSNTVSYNAGTGLGAITITGGNVAIPSLGSGQLLQWTGLGTNVTLTTATVVSTGSTYTTATGVVVLKLTAGNAANFSVNELIVVSALSGTGANLASLNGTFNVTAVSTTNNTISYNAGAGFGTITITGGNVAAMSDYGLVGYDDFRSAAASGSLQITDADLVHQITALRSLNNYLFIVGDQSVKQIGNISLNATGTATNFTILTLSSDQGTLYPRSCLSFNRIFMFVNPNGVYGVFGSTVQKISDDLDGIFEDVGFSQQPQSALLDLNAIHNAVWLLSYNDPVAGTRSIMIMFDGRRWWVTSQGTNLAAIASAPLLSSDLSVIYGTLTGTDITQLFANENTAVAWKAQTSLTPHGNVVQGKKIIRAGFTAQASGSATLTMVLGGDNSSQTLVWPVTAQSLLVGGTNDNNNAHVNTSGVNIGMTLSGTLAGFTLINMILEIQETSLWKGA